MITLPTKPFKDPSVKPELLIFYGHSKVGKTRVFSSIPNNLIIDTEGGSRFYDSMAVQVRTLDDLREVTKQLKESMVENGKSPYDYITIDVATNLIAMVKPLALQLYQKTPLALRKDGGLYNGDILDLPKGGGYSFVYKAFQQVIDSLKPYCQTLILVTHEKEKSKFKDDSSDETILTPDLPGQFAETQAGNADGIGHFERDGNLTLINFKSNGDIVKGSRIDHLREKVITIIEGNDDGSIKRINLSQLFPEVQDVIF